ncbi:hypothetical protein EAF00_001134 [Botryotinia globosa]|nr:hypothetical protein EAF00_001134 [Botryotinia globosa]
MVRATCARFSWPFDDAPTKLQQSEESCGRKEENEIQREEWRVTVEARRHFDNMLIIAMLANSAGLLKLGILPSTCEDRRWKATRLARGFVSLPWTLATFEVLVDDTKKKKKEEEKEEKKEKKEKEKEKGKKKEEKEKKKEKKKILSIHSAGGSESRLSIKTNKQQHPKFKTVYLQGK